MLNKEIIVVLGNGVKKYGPKALAVAAGALSALNEYNRKQEFEELKKTVAELQKK